MAVAVSGALSLSSIAAEFGGTSELPLSAFYRGAGRVPSSGAPNRGIPASGAISFSAFRGGALTAVVDYEIIGGGGGGGHGVGDGTASGRAGAGGVTIVTSTGTQSVSAAGGLGGLNGQAPRSGNNGEGTAYGPGGAGGNVNSAGGAAPSSSYGAGGGGGGGDNPSTYDSSGAGGFGGSAGSRRIGSIEAVYGSLLIVSVGARGLGSTAGYQGGDGAAGYARLAWDEKAASFTASGSVSVV
ncbi:hypothetical protein XMV208_000649 [Aliiroseovarius sp. xm-v-208]|nr:hypothetical protein [Aliiroseovarius sp. xm-v-208]